jgi:hypothetical protein
MAALVRRASWEEGEIAYGNPRRDGRAEDVLGEVVVWQGGSKGGNPANQCVSSSDKLPSVFLLQRVRSLTRANCIRLLTNSLAPSGETVLNVCVMLILGTDNDPNGCPPSHFRQSAALVTSDSSPFVLGTTLWRQSSGYDWEAFGGCAWGGGGEEEKHMTTDRTAQKLGSATWVAKPGPKGLRSTDVHLGAVTLQPACLHVPLHEL